MSAAPVRPWLRDFRRPWLWLGIWLLMIGAVVATSLVSAQDLPPAPFDGVDKVEHFLAYLILAAYAVMLFQGRRAQSVAVAGLIGLGIGLEFAQGALTVSRQADSADALANALGALGGLVLGPTPAALALEWLDRRVTR
ncbi:VanZ family protein [Lysobacter sp. LF1]|uniref:VanZ family protein n=1 Tax=Lysobacter stagni TaxID=3045172 RepID=A0ABT6XD39_9GAMM|nr:VanZ family protein [Lysobacter sp. LF1]MDI9237843.1 VanZ family protein [Lysobacter sp. LF1]